MNSHGVNEFVHSFFHAKVQHSHTYVVDNIGASLFAQKILLFVHKSTCLFWKISAHFLCFCFLLSQFSVSYSKVRLSFWKSWEKLMLTKYFTCKKFMNIQNSFLFFVKASWELVKPSQILLLLLKKLLLFPTCYFHKSP